MIKTLLFLLFLNISIYGGVSSSPKFNFTEIISESEINPGNVKLAVQKAIHEGLPVSILSKEGIIILMEK